MGSDCAHHKDDHEYDFGADQNYYKRIDRGYYDEQPAEDDGRYEGVHKRCDWTNEPYYHYEQFAENEDHDKDIYEWGNKRKSEGRENDRKHGSDVFAGMDCYNY